MSPHTPKHDDNLEAGLLNSTDEKATEKGSGSRSASLPSREETPKENMPSPRHLLVTLVVCFLVTFSLASVLSHNIHPCLEEKGTERDAPVEDLNANQGGESDSSFAGLLRSASPDVLHRLLHAYFPDRYQHGVYASDHDALVAVHEKNAPLASTLAQLAKRQNGNSTDTPPPDTSDPTPDTSEPTPDPTNNPDPTPTDDGQTANTEPPTSKTPDPTPDPTPTDDSNDKPDTTEKTTPKTTRTPSKSASATTMTSTLPDGGITVITSTSYYDVYPAEETDTDTRPSASLQNAGPRRTGEAILPVMLGMAIGGLLAV